MNEYQKKYEELVYFRKFILPIKRWNRLSENQKTINLPPLYAEYHHIKPRKLFPELEKDKNNIVCLTAYEHILAHKYLMLWYEIEFGKNSKEYRCVVNGYKRSITRGSKYSNVTITLLEASQLKNTLSYVLSKQRKEWWSKQENKEKMRLSHINDIRTELHNNNIRLALLGRKHTETAKLNMKNACQELHKQKVYVTNGIKNILAFPDKIPEGFYIGRVQRSGFIWINNGKIQKLLLKNEPIPDGFIKGILKR